METTTKAKSPRRGADKKRRTCLNLDEFLLDKLKEVERRTGAPMSVTARRLLREAFEAKEQTP